MVGVIDTVLFACGPALDVALCFSMFVRKRVSLFPAVFAFGALDLTSSAVLLGVDPSGVSRLYLRLYVIFDALSFVLQLLILFELARTVLRPAGIWARGAIKPLALVGGAGTALAFLTASLLEPSGIHGAESIQLRAEIFTSLLACELVIAMMLSAKEVGLPWRSHAMAVGQGLMFWSLVEATVEGFSAYMVPRDPYYHALYYVRSINYLVMVTYWTVSLWRTEPERLPISPTLRKYVVALHERVQYDLGKVGH